MVDVAVEFGANRSTAVHEMFEVLQLEINLHRLTTNTKGNSFVELESNDTSWYK